MALFRFVFAIHILATCSCKHSCSGKSPCPIFVGIKGVGAYKYSINNYFCEVKAEINYYGKVISTVSSTEGIDED